MEAHLVYLPLFEERLQISSSPVLRVNSTGIAMFMSMCTFMPCASVLVCLHHILPSNVYFLRQGGKY